MATVHTPPPVERDTPPEHVRLARLESRVGVAASSSPLVPRLLVLERRLGSPTSSVSSVEARLARLELTASSRGL